MPDARLSCIPSHNRHKSSIAILPAIQENFFTSSHTYPCSSLRSTVMHQQPSDSTNLQSGVEDITTYQPHLWLLPDSPQFETFSNTYASSCNVRAKDKSQPCCLSNIKIQSKTAEPQIKNEVQSDPDGALIDQESARDEVLARRRLEVQHVNFTENHHERTIFRQEDEEDSVFEGAGTPSLWNLNQNCPRKPYIHQAIPASCQKASKSTFRAYAAQNTCKHLRFPIISIKTSFDIFVD